MKGHDGKLQPDIINRRGYLCVREETVSQVKHILITSPEGDLSGVYAMYGDFTVVGSFAKEQIAICIRVPQTSAQLPEVFGILPTDLLEEPE